MTGSWSTSRYGMADRRVVLETDPSAASFNREDLAMAEKPIPDEAKRTFAVVLRDGGLYDSLYRMRLSEAELYRLHQARELILEAGWVEDPEKPGRFIPPSDPSEPSARCLRS
jgi:hypothetical protein